MFLRQSEYSGVGVFGGRGTFLLGMVVKEKAVALWGWELLGSKPKQEEKRLISFFQSEPGVSIELLCFPAPIGRDNNTGFKPRGRGVLKNTLKGNKYLVLKEFLSFRKGEMNF